MHRPIVYHPLFYVTVLHGTNDNCNRRKKNYCFPVLCWHVNTISEEFCISMNTQADEEGKKTRSHVKLEMNGN